MKQNLGIVSALAVVSGSVLVARAGAPDLSAQVDALVSWYITAGGQQPDGLHLPRVIIHESGPADLAPAEQEAAIPPMLSSNVVAKTIGQTADHKAAWVGVETRLDQYCYVMGCPKVAPTVNTAKVTMVLDSGSPWQPLAIHISLPAADADAFNDPLPPLARKIEPGAEDVVKQLEATIGDPKAFVATVSDRKEVVLYGSARADKFVGGATVAAKLAKWDLAFKVRDNGVQAGVTTSKQLAWIVANVDAVPAKKPTAKATPYRAMFVYELTGTAWRLVVAHFSISERVM